ncbi:hypothetical protein CI238_11191 [Colletotrichum incanum]|uniref:RING-type domain-containing protein n=1 Tax=Colletotrichum incanum TaxID=1573173 RepID=A0A161W2E3_COLIC|nr:hypothetical protein CI238_11191 [Colletotrichum incanum]
MCMELWRRYICSKPPHYTPTSDLNVGRDNHPQPRNDVVDHHLVEEFHNIFRENRESPQDNADGSCQIHWVYNLIRCAHLYSQDCATSSCVGMKIQYFDSACSYCTGSIDVHVDEDHEIKREINLPLQVPSNEVNMEQQALHGFEQYREKYLLQLLQLFHVVLLKPIPLQPETVIWKTFIETAWPETFCKLEYGHIGHGSLACECEATTEEWRTNTAYSKRKNEALAILNSLESRSGPHGAYVYYWWTQGFGEDDDWQPTARADSLYSKYHPENDFLPVQMTFVNFKREDYDKRYQNLREMAENCLGQLKQKGEDVSQEHPKTGYWQQCGIRWIGLDNWEKSLDRRMEFLEWVYQFLALDVGLHENVMMYLGAALLAMLNPWPNPQIHDHPSHPPLYALDTQMAAFDVLQECIWWVEYLWPLDDNLKIQDSYKESISASSVANEIIQRNREIELLDMKSRNRSAEHKTRKLARPPEEAIAQGDTICPLCQEEWNHFPFHDPVKLPCCNKFVGRRCMKQWLASKPIRPAGNNYMTREKWVEEFTCALCRKGVGSHFSPNFFGQMLDAPPKDVRDFNFYDDFEGFPKPSHYWQ